MLNICIKNVNHDNKMGDQMKYDTIRLQYWKYGFSLRNIGQYPDLDRPCLTIISNTGNSVINNTGTKPNAYCI